MPTADIYQIEVEGTTHNLFDVDPGFYLLMSIDGESLGRTLLDAGPGRIGKVQVFTPWLNAGAHRVRLFWDNARKGRSLQVNAVRLQALQGPDADHNGVKDWVENKLKTENGIETGGHASPTPLTHKSALAVLHSAILSRTSPACLEGRGGFLSMMRITAPGQRIVPQHGAGKRWYANVPLSETQNTTVEVSFQKGGFRQSAQIIWEPIDPLHAEDLTIRQGDALLFAVGSASLRTTGAEPEASAAQSGEPENAHVRIEIAGQLQFVGPLSKRVPHRFDQAGTFTVTATYSDTQGAVQKRSITVKVVAGSFEGSPVAWTRRERAWDCPQIPSDAAIDYDPRITFSEEAALLKGGQRFRLKIDAGEDRWVLARLDRGGPIFAATTIRGIDIDGVSESGAYYGKQYDDGSRMVETAVAQSRVFSDVHVELNIIVGGVMFDDGTLVKTLRPEDFDPTGLAVLNFLMPPGVQTSNCHVMRAYQNGTYLGEY